VHKLCAAQAYDRLLALAEQRDGGQIPRIVRFLASAYSGKAFPFDPFEQRAVDVNISDDMLVCLDALRWAKADLHQLVLDGERRVLSVFATWGLRWPDGRQLPAVGSRGGDRVD
jgi:hypothetical protein